MGNLFRNAGTIAVVLCVFIICALAAPIYAAGTPADAPVSAADLESRIQATAKFLLKEVTAPAISSVGGEWTLIGLARGGIDVPASYYDAYYDRAVKTLQESGGVLHRVKYTEYSRLILALGAIGRGDVRDVGGYNLLEKLADFETLKVQGLNGPIFALIALDSKNYEIPLVKGIAVQTTREKLVDYILSQESTDVDGVKGGFSLGGGAPELDVTAMALQALAKYKNQPKVSQAIERGLAALEKLEGRTNSDALWSNLSAESLAQIVVAKSALGLDAAAQLGSLMKYAGNDGSFSHEAALGYDLMATEQTFYAMVAYDRYLRGEAPLYDMSGAGENSNSAGGAKGGKYLFGENVYAAVFSGGGRLVSDKT